MTRGLIDTRLSKRLEPRFYPDRGTVQVATFTRGTAGSKVPTWADDPDRSDIPCRVAPTGGGEVERSDQVLTNITHRIGLSSDFGITTAERFVANGQVFDIILVETDSESHATYLNCLVVE